MNFRVTALAVTVNGILVLAGSDYARSIYIRSNINTHGRIVGIHMIRIHKPEILPFIGKVLPVHGQTAHH